MGDARCLDCGMAYEDFPLDVTLPDAQWAMIAKPHELLCAGCIVARASNVPEAIAVRMTIDLQTRERLDN